MGCCSSRANNDGNQEYSNTNKVQILADLKEKKDMAKHFEDGWRLHHQFEADDKVKRYFLTYVIEVSNEEILKTKQFTVSEPALLEKLNEIPNYEVIFANVANLKVLSENYSEYGFDFANTALIDSFVIAEKTQTKPDDVAVFKACRTCFGVTKSTDEVTVPPPKVVTPKEVHPDPSAQTDAQNVNADPSAPEVKKEEPPATVA